MMFGTASNNRLTSIPEELCDHPQLQQLFCTFIPISQHAFYITFFLPFVSRQCMCYVTVANNRISSLPDKFSPRSALLLLDCTGNCLKSIPFSIRLVPHLEFYTCLYLQLVPLILDHSHTALVSQSAATELKDFHKCSSCRQVNHRLYHWDLVTMP